MATSSFFKNFTVTKENAEQFVNALKASRMPELKRNVRYATKEELRAAIDKSRKVGK